MKLKSALKRSVALSLAAMMVLSTAGCGKSDKTKENPDNKTTEGTESTQKPNSDKPFDGVTVKWALTDNAATGSETKEMVELIKEKTGINVDFFITPTSKAGEMDKVLVSLMAGEEIDIVNRTPLQLEEFYKAAVLEPIDEFAKADNYDMDTIYGGQTVKFEDQTYAIPAEKDIWLTYYNKKIFDDANVP